MVYMTSINMKKLLMSFALITLKAFGFEDLTLISETRSAFLSKYEAYISTVMMHFTVPRDVLFVSFKFRAAESNLDQKERCNKNVSLYLTHGAPPVINPDNSTFPKHFILSTQSKMFYLDFAPNKMPRYFNLTSPADGSYFAVAHHPYVDPREEKIKQQGFESLCQTYIDAYLYVKPTNIKIFLVEQKIEAQVSTLQTNVVYKLLVPPNNLDQIELSIFDIQFCKNCEKLEILVNYKKLPVIGDASTRTYNVPKNNTRFTKIIRLFEATACYIVYQFKSTNLTEVDDGLLSFEIKNVTVLPFNVSTLTYPNYITKYYYFGTNLERMKYKIYSLSKMMGSESFFYTFEQRPLADGSIPITMNMTGENEVSVLQFDIGSLLDVGGALQMVLAFKPRVERDANGKFLQMVPEPPENTIVACLSRDILAMPVQSNRCITSTGAEFNTTLVLNVTNKTASGIVPFPSIGTWYLSLKLFCSPCERCACPTACTEAFDSCNAECRASCYTIQSTDSPKNTTKCDLCLHMCQKLVLTNNVSECPKKHCDGCMGACRYSQRPQEVNHTLNCNSSALFDITSFPCVNKECGDNGKCVIVVSEGFAFSSCLCSNFYRGWDCSDASLANSYATIIMEMLLLILSNIAFLAGVVIAYMRWYYVESFIYLCAFLSSVFYHACDAGENIASFCVLPIEVLQFADFYCALLAIWMTLIGIAFLPQLATHLCHVGGAVIIANLTTANKQSLLAFLLPVLSGGLLVFISWVVRWYRDRKFDKPTKRYLCINLPVGMIVVTVALLIYTVAQTKGNYKYTHSAWHVLMALALIILLPTARMQNLRIQREPMPATPAQERIIGNSTDVERNS